MSGCRQSAAWFAQWRRAGCPCDWSQQFVRAGPHSGKVRCRVCGRTGYRGYDIPSGWQVSCLIGHRYRCGECGAPVQNLDSHWGCRSGHPVPCSTHTDTQYRALQRLIGGVP